MNAHTRWLMIVVWLFVGTAHATISGKNVILIHGFIPEHIISPPQDDGRSDALDYWEGIHPAFKNSEASLSNVIYWPSNKRLTGADGIISVVAPQIITLLEAGYCDEQCVILTHSTGDIIARFLLKNKLSLFGKLNERFKVAAVIDLAGAGGGTELANYAVGFANGINFSSDVISALFEYIGLSIKFGLDVGVVNDLQPAIARHHATNSFPAIPHLRIAGAGSHFWGFATKPLILGVDDSVVPLHSSCGSATVSAYKSCSQDIRIDGRVTSVSAAPSLATLYDYHYPLIMSDAIAHNDMKSNATGQAMTSVRNYELAYGGNSDVLAVDVDDVEKREWWAWWRTYRWVRDAEQKSVTAVLVDSVVQ